MSIIRIAPIREENIAAAKELDDELSRVLMSADVGRCDRIVSSILTLSEPENDICLTLGDWLQYLADVRLLAPDFQANCVLKRSELQILAAAAQARGNTQFQKMTAYAGCVMLPQLGGETEEEETCHV